MFLWRIKTPSNKLPETESGNVNVLTDLGLCFPNMAEFKRHNLYIYSKYWENLTILGQLNQSPAES